MTLHTRFPIHPFQIRYHDIMKDINIKIKSLRLESCKCRRGMIYTKQNTYIIQDRTEHSQVES